MYFYLYDANVDKYLTCNESGNFTWDEFDENTVWAFCKVQTESGMKKLDSTFSAFIKWHDDSFGEIVIVKGLGGRPSFFEAYDFIEVMVDPSLKENIFLAKP